MTVQDVGTLLRSSEWQVLDSRNSQILFLSEFTEIDTTTALTTEDIAMSARSDTEPGWKGTAQTHRTEP
jgi:hypothetical protein